MELASHNGTAAHAAAPAAASSAAAEDEAMSRDDRCAAEGEMFDMGRGVVVTVNHI